MNTITDYKKRFFNLLESEMGNVKPLITEDTTKDDASLNYIVNAVANYINGVIAKRRTTDPTFPDAKVEVTKNSNAKYQGEPDSTYWFKFNGVEIPKYDSESLSVKGMEGDTQNTVKRYATNIKYSFDNTPGSKYAPKLSKNLQKLPSLFSGISKLVDTWAAQFSPQPATKTPTTQTKPTTTTPTQKTATPIKKP
jgi:hypothetical protein